MTTRLGLVQLASPRHEPVGDRIERVEALVADAARAGAEVVVLPELWAPGYFAFDRYEALAEPLEGALRRALSHWAREHRIVLAGGSVLEREGDRLHNTALLFDESGVLVSSYRKLHTFGHDSEEARLLTAGRHVPVVSTAYGAIGMALCYDLRFPELFRVGTAAGARSYVVPAAWPASRTEHWRLLTTARAVENQMVLIGCNATGRQGPDDVIELGGHSRVVGPDGEVLAEAGTEETTLFCDLDLSCVETARLAFPAFRDRRIQPSGVPPLTDEEVAADAVL